MIARSAHFVFPKKIQFKHLAKVFPDVFNFFLNETKQIPEEEEYVRMLVKSTIKDLEKNRKPEGYNRQGRVKMIFPIRRDGKVEFYIYRHAKSEEIGRIANGISKMLSKKKLKHKIEWDKMVLYKLKEKRDQMPK
jgi:hypothetical protein